MIQRLRLLLVIVLSCAAFVGLANVATIWNGALFIVGIVPLVWLSDWAIERARR